MDLKGLEALQTWYASQCDGDWEHGLGVRIETLDNPGWMVRINLAETVLENKPFQEINDLEPEIDWINCKVENGQYVAAGGPYKLIEMIEIFVRWAQTEKDWLTVP
jgi:hypothetical protein